MVKLALLLMLAASTPAAAAAADSLVVAGRIGSHSFSFRARRIAAEAEFLVREPVDYLAVTEIYPDVSEETTYTYSIYVGKQRIYRRSHRGTGFGPVTYFIRPDTRAPIKLRIVPDPKSSPVMISGVRGISQAQLDSLLSTDSFRILGLVPQGGDADQLVSQLARNIAAKPEYGIGRGFSSEIRYANRPAGAVKQEIETCFGWVKQHGMPAMLGLVSWWSGTPLREPDGLGGTFGDIKYQQVCYSPDVEMPENGDLRKLVGDRYDHHYGLSVPNQWSSTPWLTMNSKALNDYRLRRMDEAVGLIRSMGSDTSWLDNIYLENEPRYWDTDCEAGNPKAGRQGKVLWADFNPLVIEDAKKDGIDLNPNDGLSREELSWLHRNVGKYNQGTVNAVRGSLAARGFPTGLPVYTHSLQHRSMFPGGAINHPASEWAYADRARTGIEGLWSQPGDFERLREWGRWANINREENDGRHIDLHLWDLRVAYMMGADLYNSYNWHAIGAQRFFDYVNEFSAELPVVTLSPTQVVSLGGLSVRIRTPMKLQAFSGVEVTVEATKRVAGRAILTAGAADGQSWGSTPLRLDLGKGTHRLAFEFVTPAECPHDGPALLMLAVFDANDRPIDTGMRIVPDSSPDLKLSLDLRRLRALSLAAISSANLGAARLSHPAAPASK